MPHALRGILIAGFMAAFMSTIATQLNWGSSYLVEDFYRRFIRRDATEKHYVNVSRLATLLLVAASAYVSAQLATISQGWEVVLEVGAGTGGVYLLRWYWWRINAWSEISAMATALGMTLMLHHWRCFGGSAPVIFAKTTLATTAVTTVVWVLVTFLTPAEPDEVLLRFYRKVRPHAAGWRRIAALAPGVAANARPGPEFAGVGAGLRDGVCGVFRHREILLRANRPAGIGIAGIGHDLRGVALSRYFTACECRTHGRNRCLTRSATPAFAGLSSSGQSHAVTASFLGWTLDAFDFFVVVFLFDRLAADFHVTKAKVVASVLVTLAMRPVGALIFGLMTDRYGRRIPLMVNVVFFSVVELAVRIFTEPHVFPDHARALRHRHGRRVGNWRIAGDGIGPAAVARNSFRHLAERIFGWHICWRPWWRGLCCPTWGWRPMFWIGGLPALLAFYIAARVPESEAWKQHRAPSTGAVLKIVASQWKSFLYLVFLMTFMMFLSHGTQDLYPDFLGTVHNWRRRCDPTWPFFTISAPLSAQLFSGNFPRGWDEASR